MLVLISYKPADLTIMTSFRLSKLMLGNYLIFHSNHLTIICSSLINYNAYMKLQTVMNLKDKNIH